MKFKKMMLVTILLLAILTIGAVSASENATIDDGLTASNITEDTIEEASVDDVIEEAPEDATGANWQDFNVTFNENPVKLYEDDFVLNFTAPENTNGVVEIKNNDTGGVWRYSIFQEPYSYTVYVTPHNLNIYAPGTYFISATYHEQGSSPLFLGRATITAIDKEGFSAFRNGEVRNESHPVFSLSEVKDSGNLDIYVDGKKVGVWAIEKDQSIELFADDLNITENGYYNIRARFSMDNMDERFILADYNATVRINSAPKSFKDLHDYMYDEGNVIRNKETHLYDNYKYNPDTDYEIIDYGQGLPLNDDGITIYGHDVTIDGSGLAPVFSLFDDHKEIYINDITFINCRSAYADFGGGVLNNPENKGYIWFINCTFIDNYGRGDGGALSGQGFAHYCRFINNTADGNGGALSGYAAAYSTFIGNYARGSGGAMNGGTATSSTFENNTADHDGGAILNGNSLDCTFTENHANGNGGAMCNAEQAEMSTFENNTAGSNGGAVYNGNAKNSKFITNVAQGCGGAICEGNATDSTFFLNLAFSDGEEASNASCENCNFTNATLIVSSDYLKTWEYSCENISVNLTNHDGSLIDFNITVSIYDYDTFRRNESCLSGGEWIADLYPGYFTIVFSIPNNNVKPVNVTVEVLATSNITIEKSAIEYNSSDKLKINLSSSGDVPIKNATLTVDFNGNVTNYTTDDDGSIYISVIDLPMGEYDINVYFAGNDFYNATSAAAQFNVTKISPTLSADDFYTIFDKDDYFVVNLTDGRGNPIEGANVTVDLNGTNTYITDKNGQINVSTKNLAINSYAARISYNGSEIYNATEIEIKVDVENPTHFIAEDLNTTYGSDDYILVTLVDLLGDVMGGYEVQVTIFDTKSEWLDSFGQLKIPTVNLNASTYNVTVRFPGNEFYSASTITVNLTVDKVNSTLNISDDNITFDWNATGHCFIKATGGIGINVTVIGQPNAVIEVESGDGYTFSNVTAGNHILSVTTIPDENHISVTQTVNVTVNKVNSTVNISDVDIDYGIKNITVDVQGASGIDAEIDGVKVNATGNVIALPDLTVGNHTLTVTIIPDENHTAVSKTVNLTVNKANITLKIDPVELYYGTLTNITVEAVGATSITATIDGVNATVVGNEIIVPDLDIGNYTLVVSAIPDENHTAVSKTVIIIVNKPISTLKIDPVELYYGIPANITVETVGATAITAEIDGVNVTVIDNLILISDLAGGIHNLTVTTVPDENHSAVSKTVNVTVIKANSTLNVSDVDMDYGIVRNVTVDIQGATGVVAEIDGKEVNASGNVVVISDLSAGVHNLTVTTVPDENHTAVSQTVNVTVNKVNSTLNVSEVVMDYGVVGNVTVDIQGATGVVAEIDGKEVNASGNVVLISGLSAGVHNLTVTTVPDENHTAVSQTVNVTVNKVNSTLDVNPVELYYDVPANITVETVGVASIIASIDGVNATVAGNEIIVPQLDVGNYTLIVSAIPDENHTAVSKTLSIYINKSNSSVIINDLEWDYGAPNNISAITEGVTSIAATLDGQDVNVTGDIISIPILAVGTYNLTVATTPDENHIAVNKTFKITIRKAKSTISLSNDIVFDYGASGWTNVSFTGADNVTAIVINNTGANVTINGSMITVSGLNGGNYILSVTTVSDANHTAATATVNITVNRLATVISVPSVTTTYGTSKWVTITLTSNGTYLEGKNVTVVINNVSYSGTTDSNGQFKVATSKTLLVNTYAVAVSFEGDAKYVGSTASSSVLVNKATPKFVAKAKTFKRTVKTKKYTVTLKTDKNVVMKNVKVTVKINKKTYSAKTNSKGVATFKITKLTKKAKYIALIKYKGNSKYKAISKKVLITLK